MNATNYYVSTTRLVLQADPESLPTWQDLYTALPTLRNSLSCTVCENLLSEPYTPEETTCEHHVCKGCKGGVKKLRPTCSWCKDYSKYSENVHLRILIQNYKKLCGLIKINKMFGQLIKNKEQGSLIRDIIRESEGEKISKSMLVENVRPPVIKTEPIQPSTESGNVEEVEPVDEIISSPYSKLKQKPSFKVAAPLSTDVAKPTPKASPASSPPSASPPTVVAVGRLSSGFRKRKSEAFILDPLKGKADLPHLRKHDSSSKNIKSETSVTKQTLLSDYGISSSPKSSKIEEVSKHSDSPKASAAIAKRRLGCRCGNATQCPGKLTCCGQRCPCYADNLACTDCKCKGCRNPHRPGGGKVRPTLPVMENMQVVYPEAKTSQHATVKVPVSFASTESFNLKGLDLSQLPVVTFDSNSKASNYQLSSSSSHGSAKKKLQTISVFSLVNTPTTVEETKKPYRIL